MSATLRKKDISGKPVEKKFTWKSTLEGVWRGMAGNGAYVSMLSMAGVEPRGDAIARMGRGTMPFKSAGAGWRKTGVGLLLSFPLDTTEKLYGLGLNFETLDQRGHVRELKMDHYGGHDTGHTHAPVPFYVSDRGYGVFVDVAERIKVYAGTTHPTRMPHPPIYDRTTDAGWRDVSLSRRVEMLVPGGAAAVYVFTGPTMLDVVRRFNLLCGGGCLPPRWGLGFWHRVPMTFNAADTEAEARLFSEHGFPLDVIGMEPGWHSGSYPTSCEFSPERFPDPGGFADHLKQMGIRINLWENCMIDPRSPLGKSVKPYSGDYYAGWGGRIADLASPEACGTIAAHHDKKHVALGYAGYKLDECDGHDQWLWPDHAAFPSGLNGVQLRQVYGVLFQKLTTGIFGKRDLRTYGQVRASNAGGVSFPYVIYNDCYDHRQYITGLINSGFCGVLFTPEARGAESPEEWLRRMQAVCLSPLAQINAWSKRVLPWSFPEVEQAVLEAMHLRMRLIPYLYSAFARYRDEGVPPFRALVLDDCLSRRSEKYVQGDLDDTANPYMRALCRDIRDQYILGDSIMVAPLFAGEKSRPVVIPNGNWYDFHTGAFVGSNTVLTVDGNRSEIPMYIRDGGIVPMFADPLRQVPAAGTTMEIEVRHYGTAPGSFALYDDDGETMAYEKGARCWIPLSVERAGNGKLAGNVGKAQGTYSSTYAIRGWTFMT